MIPAAPFTIGNGAGCASGASALGSLGSLSGSGNVLGGVANETLGALAGIASSLMSFEQVFSQAVEGSAAQSGLMVSSGAEAVAFPGLDGAVSDGASDAEAVGSVLTGDGDQGEAGGFRKSFLPEDGGNGAKAAPQVQGAGLSDALLAQVAVTTAPQAASVNAATQSASQAGAQAGAMPYSTFVSAATPTPGGAASQPGSGEQVWQLGELGYQLGKALETTVAARFSLASSATEAAIAPTVSTPGAQTATPGAQAAAPAAQPVAQSVAAATPVAAPAVSESVSIPAAVQATQPAQSTPASPVAPVVGAASSIPVSETVLQPKAAPSVSTGESAKLAAPAQAGSEAAAVGSAQQNLTSQNAAAAASSMAMRTVSAKGQGAAGTSGTLNESAASQDKATVGAQTSSQSARAGQTPRPLAETGARVRQNETAPAKSETSDKVSASRQQNDSGVAKSSRALDGQSESSTIRGRFEAAPSTKSTLSTPSAQTAQSSDTAVASVSLGEENVWQAEPKRANGKVVRLPRMIEQVRQAAEFLASRTEGTVKMGDGTVQARLKLYPPTLGEVQVELNLQGGTTASAKFVAARPEAAVLLNNHMQEFREAMARNGVNVDQVQVSVSAREVSSSSGSHNAQWRDGGQQNGEGRNGESRRDASADQESFDQDRGGNRRNQFKGEEWEF